MIDKINWLQVAVGFLSGGAFGALIKIFYDYRQSKIQTIGKIIELKSLYDSSENHLLNTQIILTGSTQTHTFSNLYNCTIKIVNTSNKDYDSFKFGITCASQIKIINVKSKSSDRHHLIDFDERPSLENQLYKFDVALSPFNRKDAYELEISLTTDRGSISEEDIQISSAHPVKWSDIDNFGVNTKIVLSMADMLIAVSPLYSIFVRIKNTRKSS